MKKIATYVGEFLALVFIFVLGYFMLLMAG